MQPNQTIMLIRRGATMKEIKWYILVHDGERTMIAGAHRLSELTLQLIIQGRWFYYGKL